MSLPSTPSASGTHSPICIAVCAMGGQGGGVLVNWIVALAERHGWVAQSTSVPGVAQRTGATIYYIEIVPVLPDAERPPVLALMPTPGEVDIVLGAELMEGGRAMLRGLVTPDRTTLITSSHRNFAIEERIVPGNGEADPTVVYEAAGIAAQHFICLDMASLAEQARSVISSVMFGVLAGSGRLPFTPESYQETIRAGGIGVAGSLRGFALGLAHAQDAGNTTDTLPATATPQPLSHVGNAAFDALLDRARALPQAAHAMLDAGLRQVVDYQDIEYGREYLGLLEDLARLDQLHGGADHDHMLVTEAARHIANAMTYDDVIRVADLKTRATRFARIAQEVGVAEGQPLALTEFMHPRPEEICGLLPAPLGRMMTSRPLPRAAMQRLFSHGWRVRTDKVSWFVALSAVAGMRAFRRGNLRHAEETAHRDRWLATVTATVPTDYALATEMLKNRRLIKGYSDTHARGESKFERVMAGAVRMRGHDYAATWTRLLREAALRDEDGKALDDTFRTIETFS